jgi:FkbM family methyltransferase
MIVDAGANIGDTTSWYLSRFPDARLFALEPDSANYEMLVRNCRAYGSRAELMQCGLWSRSAHLKISGSRHMESGLSVTEVNSESEADCLGVSLTDILGRSGESAIDIFKCDIEDAEQVVFSAGCDEWLSRTHAIFIEIHSPSSLSAVVTATKRHNFSHRIYRDLHIFQQP